MSRNLQAEISVRILAHLKSGVIPWRKPWSGKAGAGGMPRNAVTGRAYSGCNVVLLWMTADECGYAESKWLTFQQAISAGGSVRKGEKGTTVIYVSTFEREDAASGKMARIPFLKAFTVFNIAQCDGLDLGAPAPIAIKSEHERDELTEAFLLATGAKFTFGESRAYYRPASDSINIPHLSTFESSQAYYSVNFHELTHWTGAESRLNRTFGKRFGDVAYSAEELVAELGAAFLCAEFGYDNDVIENQSAYIAHWIKLLENHEAMFTAAASGASKAVEYMRGVALADEALAA